METNKKTSTKASKKPEANVAAPEIGAHIIGDFLASKKPEANVAAPEVVTSVAKKKSFLEIITFGLYKPRN